MTVQQLNSKFEKVIDELTGDSLGNIMIGIGLEARKMIYDRVHGTGANAEGQKYTPYSTKSMLSGCANLNSAVCERLIGSKNKRSEKKWVTLDKLNKAGKKIRLFEIPGGYKELRELHGRQTGFVDFAFTNRMWNNIKLKQDRMNLNRGIAVIGTTEDTEQKKLAGNTARRGEILKLSQAEITELSGKLDNKIQEIFKRNEL